MDIQFLTALISLSDLSGSVVILYCYNRSEN